MSKRNGKMKYLAIGAAGLIAAGGLALDATYQIQEQEQAVLTTFGVPKAVTETGLHFKVPFVQQVQKVNTTIQGFPIGYSMGNNEVVENEGIMITSDYNFIDVDFFVEYRISEPVKYLYTSEQPEEILKNIAQSCIRTVIASYNVDEVLTTGKGEIQSKIKEMILNQMEEQDLGIQLVNITIQDSEPLKLNIGNPYPFGFSAPQEVILDMLSNIRTSQGYSDSKGIFSARKAIMQYAQLRGIPGVTMGDIYTGNGVSELINLCMQALLDNGDEILIPAPDYPLWTATATLAGGNVVHYICDEQSEWYPDIDDIKSKITDKTKAIVIINPNNPTGAVYPKEILEQIVQIAREHELIIFSDEIYDRLIMDGYKHTSIASLAPDVFCVTFSGLSKSHMIAGFRRPW